MKIFTDITITELALLFIFIGAVIRRDVNDMIFSIVVLLYVKSVKDKLI